MRQQRDRSLWTVEHLEGLLAGVDAIVWEADADTFDFTFVNQRAQEILGYPVERWYESGFWASIVHPEDRATVVAFCREASERGEDHNFEYRALTSDGRELWLRDFVRVHIDLDTGTKLLRGVMVDITAEKERETLLTRSEDRFRALVQNSSDVIAVIDAGGTINYVSPSVEALAGYRPDELVGRSGLGFIYPEDDEEALQNLARILDSPGETITVEWALPHRDGSELHLEIVVTNLLDEPSVGGIVANVRDITERKLTEMALRAANAVQAELAAILFSSADAIIGATLEGVISSWNDAAERLFGYSRGEIMGKRVDLLIPDHPGFDQKRITELLSVGKAEFESRGRRRDGTLVEVAVTLSPIRDEHGTMTGISGSIRDIGERRALEAQLREAQKMEAVARLAGGVSHDFNNLLTTILGNCELLLEDVSLGAEIREQISDIREAAEIGGSITAQLLDISRRRVVVEETISLRHVVEQMNGVLRRLLGEDIELVAHMADADLTVRGDAGQLEQVVLNLAVNARDAMPEGGTFTLGLETVEVAGGALSEGLGLGEGLYAVLTATDTGQGMTPEVRERIFEPFFTTKAGTYATGLGLSTVYQIVSQMGGSISVASSPGVGTTFRLFLPISRDRSMNPPARDLPPSRGAQGSVLLVEDDERVRTVTRRILEQDGYTVTEAANALDAIAKVDASGGSFELLVSDIVMPGMDGPELARELGERVPGLKVLLISGYSGHALEGPFGIADAFLAKPFRPRDLLGKVAEVLEVSP